MFDKVNRICALLFKLYYRKQKAHERRRKIQQTGISITTCTIT